MKTKYIAGVVVFAFVAILAVNLVAAGSFGNGLKLFAPSEDDRDSMKTAIENEDYSSWKALMEDRIEQMKSQITEENFNRMVEFHKNMNQTEMPGRGMHKEMGKGQFSGNCPRKE